MSRERPGFFVRLAPWVGALVVAMGATQAGLTLMKPGNPDLRLLGTGLLIAGGGLGLVARRGGLRPRNVALVLAALGIAATVVLLARPDPM